MTVHPDGSWTAFVGGHYEVDSVAGGVVSGTTVLQPGSEGQDSYVYSSYPSTNYGNSAYIYAGKVSSSQTYRGLLEFDLASIPADAVVDQATLTLYCRKLSTASATLYLYRVTKGWGESSVTWNSQPATGSQVEGTLNLATSRYQAKEVELTALVQAWVEGSQVNQGVMVKEGGSTAYGQCYSSDTGTAGYRPKLEVHWHRPPQPTTRSYYYFGSQRVAMQVDDVIYYIHTDHLGSTSAMSDESGTLVTGSVTRYLPYGGYRTAAGANLTDHGFTGHKHNSYIKLVDMKARWYSPQLGRFISADSIIPDPLNPQSFNRYSYVLNSPLNYTDPTGHAVDCGDDCYLNDEAIAAYLMAGIPRDFVVDRLNAEWGGVLPAGNTELGHFVADVARAYYNANPGDPYAEELFYQYTMGVAWDLYGVYDLMQAEGIGSMAEAMGSTLALGFTAVARYVQPVQPYEVGPVDDLLRRSRIGDGLSIHHLPQQHPASQVVPAYDPKTAPGIALPRGEHRRIRNLQGPYSSTARDLVARDLWNLRVHTEAPNNALGDLLSLIRAMYPGVLDK